MIGNRIGVLICGPLCLGLAVLAGERIGLDSFEAVRIASIAGIGGWILGRWR